MTLRWFLPENQFKRQRLMRFCLYAMYIAIWEKIENMSHISKYWVPRSKISQVMSWKLPQVNSNLKATNGGPQWYSDNNMMQTFIYLGTSWYFNTNRSHELKCPDEKIIKATTWGSRYKILPPVVALKGTHLTTLYSSSSSSSPSNFCFSLLDILTV